MLFYTDSRIPEYPILLSDTILIGIGIHDFKIRHSYISRCCRMDMFNANRGEVSSHYTYTRSLDPLTDSRDLTVYFQDENNLNKVVARMLALPGSDTQNLKCLDINGFTRRYGVPQEVKARGWKDYWWER